MTTGAEWKSVQAMRRSDNPMLFMRRNDRRGWDAWCRACERAADGLTPIDAHDAWLRDHGRCHLLVAR